MLDRGFLFFHIFNDLNESFAVRERRNLGIFYDLVLFIAIFWNLKEKDLILKEHLKFICAEDLQVLI
jgi:hypothetical protein